MACGSERSSSSDLALRQPSPTADGGVRSEARPALKVEAAPKEERRAPPTRCRRRRCPTRGADEPEDPRGLARPVTLPRRDLRRLAAAQSDPERDLRVSQRLQREPRDPPTQIYHGLFDGAWSQSNRAL